MDALSLLANWAKLNEGILNLTEEECLKLLEIEKKNHSRKRMLRRIHSRYNKLRAERERTDLDKCAKTK